MAKYLNGATGKSAAEILPAMEQLGSLFKQAIERPIPTLEAVRERNEVIQETAASLTNHARAIIGEDADGRDVIAARSILKQCYRAATSSIAASSTGDFALPKRRIEMLNITADKIGSPRGFKL